ncbi:protein of unassigned function [Methylobacterium oryzae CBMB20]|uniref:Protein of unassigned function n=1 Tax=Methylobacterium oryzae CBMB20 TaxID=693986 RepID=A0A089NVD5_9HYPH|nr:protein of unassigned function [Methylobacterium oryzae CBMB20]
MGGKQSIRLWKDEICKRTLHRDAPLFLTVPFAPSGHDRCERLGLPAYRRQQRRDPLHGQGIAAEKGNELPNGATTAI